MRQQANWTRRKQVSVEPLKLNPQLFEAWTNLGDLQRTASRWQDAAESYRKVFERQAGTLHRRMAYASLSGDLYNSARREALEANDVAMRELSVAVRSQL